jgi:glucokinase
MLRPSRSAAAVRSRAVADPGVSSVIECVDESTTKTAIGVDVGATRIKLVLISESGMVLCSQVLPTPRDASGPEILDQIATVISSFKSAAATYAPRGVGIAVPNFVVGPDWVQRWPNNMPALENVAARPVFAERFGDAIAMANDVSAAVIAEHLFGHAAGRNRIVLMSIGTGISIGVIADGELLQYTWGTSGDTGHIIVDTQGLLECSCGARGCLETVASGTGISQEALRALRRGETSELSRLGDLNRSISPEDVAEAARHGDELAARIFDRAAMFLGIALASYAHIFAPELIVLAGGVTRSFDLLQQGIHESLARFGSPSRLSVLEDVVVSAFPELGAAIGSASLILFPDRYLPSSLAAERV